MLLSEITKCYTPCNIFHCKLGYADKPHECRPRSCGEIACFGNSIPGNYDIFIEDKGDQRVKVICDWVDKEPWGQILRRHTDNLDWTMSAIKILDGAIDRMTLNSGAMTLARDFAESAGGAASAEDLRRPSPQADGWIGIRKLSKLTRNGRRLKLYLEVVDDDDKVHSITASFAVSAESEGFALTVDDIRTKGDLKRELLQGSANKKFRLKPSDGCGSQLGWWASSKKGCPLMPFGDVLRVDNMPKAKKIRVMFKRDLMCKKACDNGGQCVMQGEVSKCICKKGFCGGKCHVKDTCLNRGTCLTDNNGQAFCECTSTQCGAECQWQNWCTNDGVCPLQPASQEERDALTAKGATVHSQLEPVHCLCPHKDVCGMNCSQSGDICKSIREDADKESDTPIGVIALISGLVLFVIVIFKATYDSLRNSIKAPRAKNTSPLSSKSSEIEKTVEDKNKSKKIAGKVTDEKNPSISKEYTINGALYDAGISGIGNIW